MSYPNKFNNYKKKSYNYNNNNKFNYVNKSNMPYPNYYNNYYNNFNYNYNYYNNLNTNNNYNDNLGTSMNTSYKLLFWNILCNEYSYDWKTSPKIELKYKVWEYRSKLFTEIFSNKNILSDIYCFVEVDKQDDIYLMLNNIVNQKLFESIYFPRPSTPLGIMLLYNRTKFKVINSYKYLLGNSVQQNFALVSILQEIMFPYNMFAILVTHLRAWDKNENIRIKQINKLFYNMANDNNLKNLKINKIIICGDLNTNPNSNCVKNILDNKFISVFDISKESENDGNYTMVIDTVDEGLKKLKYDYIFINNNIEILNKTLPINYLDFEKGLPNENFPSDHIYLFTEFKFCDKNKENVYDYNQIVYDHSLNYNMTKSDKNKINYNNNEKYKNINDKQTLKEKKESNDNNDNNDNNNDNKENNQIEEIKLNEIKENNNIKDNEIINNEK